MAAVQFKSALKEMNIVNVNLELCKVYVKLDQPNTAIDNYQRGLEAAPGDVALMTGIARIHSMMNNVDKAVAMYKKVRMMLCDRVTVRLCATVGVPLYRLPSMQWCCMGVFSHFFIASYVLRCSLCLLRC